jgi:23S rRNA pseudouridine1911/1915/1917 synthase
MPNQGRVMRFELTEDARGRRLDQLLVELVPQYSRSRLQTLIREGCVRLAGATVLKPGLLVLEPAAVELELSADVGSLQLPEEADALVVIHEDESLIVVDKPAGLLTHRNSLAGEGGVAEILAQRYGELPSSGDERRGGIVHRLDRETSGLLLVARTRAALESLQEQFRERSIAKTYLALVHGEPRFDTYWIENWLGRHERNRDRISIVPEGEGRFASTYYEVRERFQGFALVAVHPKTGRTHQVRVHMSSVGLPLLGDELYKPRGRALSRLPSGAPAFGRQALHAERLELAHPASGERIYFEAPLAEDMQRVLDWLRANAAE